MKLTLEWMSQLRDAAGIAQQIIECRDGSHLTEALERALDGLPEDRSGPLRTLVLSDGRRHTAILVAIDGIHVTPDADPPLTDGATILLSSPIAGG
jgi:hypothetical protein